MKKIFFLSIVAISLTFGLGQTANAAVVDSTIELNDTTDNGPILSNGDFYGASVENIGDLNGDGVNDLLVGANGDDAAGFLNWERGAIHISFMNSDGSVISTKKIDETTNNGPGLSVLDMYGISATEIGDLDNDGVVDIAVGAFGDDENGSNRGAVYIHFMNADASIKSTVKINDNDANITLSNDDYYGRSVENIGDLNGDGVDDLAVGTPNKDYFWGTDRGAVDVHLMRTDGSIISTLKIDGIAINGPTLLDSDFYGTSIANIGDLNGDGVNDLVVGASGDDTGGSNRGAIYIHYMKTDGIVLSTVKIDSDTVNGPVLNDEDSYGISVDNMGDLNGDGVNDLVVGAYMDKEGPNKKGTVYIHYMNADGSIISTEEMNGMTTNGPTLDNDDGYGWEVANIGDYNGDKVNDLAVSAYMDDNGGTNRGAVHIHFLTDTVAPVVTEVTAVASPTSDTTPEYTFNTDEAGTIEYGGGCTSATTVAVSGNNTITFNQLVAGTYNNCTIRVADAKSNTSAPLTISSFDVDPVAPIYRLYNTKTGVHLYTRGESDRDSVLTKWSDFEYTDSGPAFYASLENDGNTPIFRLYNTRTGVHLYTRGVVDREKILSKYSDFEFTDGKPAFYASIVDDGTTPIFRLYNTRTGVHLYTRGEADREKILDKYSDFEFTDGVPAFYLKTT